MGLLDSLRNIRRWFTSKTGINKSSESQKRKHEDCESINNKRVRMDDSLVEVVEISDESICEAEEVEITEPGPSTVPLRVSPPVMFIDSKRYERRPSTPIESIDICDDDEEENEKVFKLFSSSNKLFTPSGFVNKTRSTSSKSSLGFTNSTIGLRKSSSSIEGDLNSLRLNNTTHINDSKEGAMSMIFKSYVTPKSGKTNSPTSISRSPLSIRRSHSLNLSNVSKTSGKENLEIPELSHQNNRIIKHETFYERILRKFREKQAEVNYIDKAAAVALKSPDDTLDEKLESMRKQLDKIKYVKKDVFPEYTEEVLDSIKRQISGSPSDAIIPGKNIKKCDLRTVYTPTAWLNDEVINHYLSLIINREPDSLHSFDTFFYSRLCDQGYQSVRRWSRKKDIFACKKMLVPIHLGNHWCLICVNFVEKTIKYYDSLGGHNPKCLDAIMMYLKEEHMNKKQEEFNQSGWQLLNATDCPKQENSYDCGVFTCINAEYLARDAKLDYTQKDMPKLRKRICYEILNNRLCF